MKINSLFSLKKRPENGIYYMGFRNTDNTLRWVSTKCKRKADAIQFVRNYNGDSNEFKKDITLSQLLKEFLSCQTVCNSTGTIYTIATNYLIKVSGDKDIALYVAQDLERFKQMYSNKLKVNSINIYSRAMITLFSFAHKRKYISEKPFAFTQLLKTVKQPPTFLSREDFEKLINAVKNKTLKEFYKVLANTGMRLGELTNLKWENVNLEKKTNCYC